MGMAPMGMAQPAAVGGPDGSMSWWWTDGQEWYFTTPASQLRVPSGKGGMPMQPQQGQDASGPGVPQEAPEQRQGSAAPKPKAKSRAGAGGDPPDDGGDDDDTEGSDSYTYMEESEESEQREEDPPVPERARRSKSKTKPKEVKKEVKTEKPASTASSVAATEELKEMLKSRSSGDRTKPALHQVKLETFSGSRQHFRDWKRVLTAQRTLYRLEDKELSMLVYLSCKGEARQILNQLEIGEMTAEGGLSRMLHLLEEAYGSRADERFEDRQDAYLQCRRAPGQPVSKYIADLKRLRQEYLREDPDTVISDKSFAQRLLARAGLTRKERMDCFFSAGGRYKASEMERVLRFRCARIHEDEGKRSGRDRRDDSTSSGREPLRRKPYYKGPYKRSSRQGYQSSRYKKVYHAEDGDYYEDDDMQGDTDEEDLEQEAAQGYFDRRQEDHEAWYGDEAYDEEDEYDENDYRWARDDEEYEDEEEEIEVATAAELSEAYAAGWKAKAQAASLRQGRGYRSCPVDKRRPDDCKKKSKCSSCQQPGHWRGDPECPKVVSGEDKLHPRHKGKVNEANVASVEPQVAPVEARELLKTPTSPSSSPSAVRKKQKHESGSVKREPTGKKEESSSTSSLPVKLEPDAPETKITKVNWTMMASNGLWEMPDPPYYGDEDDEDDPRMDADWDNAIDEEQWEDWHGHPPATASDDPRPPSRPEFKLALETVLRALQYDDEEAARLASKKPGKEMKFTGNELIQLLPHMDKAEKRVLYKALRAEQEEIAQEAFNKQPTPDPEKMKPQRRRRGGYSGRDASAPSVAAPSQSSASASAAPSGEPPDRHVPAAVKAKELETFRRALYDNALNRRGTLTPSQASDYPTGEQEMCPHQYMDLRWGANASAHWAHCKRCKLKRVVYYSTESGAMAVRNLKEEEDSNEVLNTMGPALGAGEVIVDTRCRTAVAGCAWHRQHQQRLNALGLEFHRVAQQEMFKFGAGPPVASKWAFLYPCYTHGTHSWVRVSFVGGAASGCPGLIGPSEMGRWNVQLHFATRKMIVFDESRDMKLSLTRHPVLQLLELEEGRTSMSDWDTPALKELLETLEHSPHQMAFYENDAPDSPAASDEIEEESIASEEPAAAEVDPDPTPASLTEESLARLQDSLEYDVEVTEVLMRNAFIANDLAPQASDSEGSISKGESETSHELGAPKESEESGSSEDEFYERHGDELHAPPLEPFSKGQRRRINNAVNQVLLGFEEEKTAEREKDMAKHFTVPRPIKRRTGWKVLEVFTWTCMLSRLAYSWGWEFCEPISLPHWDLSQPREQELALDYLDRCNPDLLMVAWPCKKWSQMQHLSMKTEVQKRALRAAQLQERKTFLSFTRKAVLRQRRRGKVTLGENPVGSTAWSQPEIIDAFEGLGEATADLCQYGLKHPENGKPLRKRTRFMGQEDALQNLHLLCSGNHEHAPIEGAVKVGGRTVALSEWSGGYTLQLCQAILAGVERCLQAAPREVYHTGVMPEEVLMDGEEYIESDPEESFKEPPMLSEADLEEDLDREMERHGGPPSAEEDEAGLDAPSLPAAPEHRRFPIASETCKAVEQAHRQLGHPSRKTLVRMLRLSGASEGAIEHAKSWRCDVCASRAAPGHPTAAAAGVRPYGFNQQHQVDLKYIRDARGKKYVFLSMLDVGTAYHQAVMLKTRRSEYVASKWFRHWVEAFGLPKRVTHDQGGEFEAGFTAMMEDMSLPSTVTGAHSGWQLSLGERHGGLLGLILETIVAEHQAVGYGDMKKVLSAGVAAKNGTISRDGYTPNQRLFGTDVHFPGLTEEEERLSFAEGLGTEGEVARAHKMRLTARIALLRQDVQDKLRRSLLRRPAKGSGPFVPGSQIYFWVPRKAQRRYVPGIWRGPATVLVRESTKRYFVSWRGRCLLLSEENMRWATGEELALQSPVPEQDLQDLSRQLRDPEGNKGFEDGSHAAAPPEQPKPHWTVARQVWRDRGKAMMKGLRSAKRLLKDLPAAARRPPKRVKMLTDEQQAALKDAPAAPKWRRAARALPAPEEVQDDQIPVAPSLIPNEELQVPLWQMP